MQQIYLDHAASTPIDADVLEAMVLASKSYYANASALYITGSQSRAAIELARTNVASALQVKPTEIVFTAGGTEANNLALFGVVCTASHIVTSAIEHDSILRPIRELSKKGATCTKVLPDKMGLLSASNVLSAIKDTTVLVTIIYASNELGTVQPLRDISTGLQAIRATRLAAGNKTPLYFHTDACQAANFLPLQPHRLGVDMMTLNAGKMYGPKQCGVLYVAKGVALQPLIYGGGQEMGLRAGTESISNAIAFSTALVNASSIKAEQTKRMKNIKKVFVANLLMQIPGARVNGHSSLCLPNIVHITIPGIDNERVVYQLDAQGIMVATGSACSTSSGNLNHVLEAIGFDKAAMQSSLRISMGKSTSLEQMDKVLLALKTLVH